LYFRKGQTEYKMKTISNLPDFIFNSDHLTGNHLAKLASIAIFSQTDPSYRDERLEALLRYMKGERLSEKLHEYARELMEEEKVDAAWQVLLRHPNNQN
jgi:hypothetical protein